MVRTFNIFKSQSKSLPLGQHHPHKPSPPLMSLLTPNQPQTHWQEWCSWFWLHSKIKVKISCVQSACGRYRAARHGAVAVVDTSVVPLWYHYVAVHTALPVRCWFKYAEFGAPLWRCEITHMAILPSNPSIDQLILHESKPPPKVTLLVFLAWPIPHTKIIWCCWPQPKFHC